MDRVPGDKKIERGGTSSVSSHYSKVNDLIRSELLALIKSWGLVLPAGKEDDVSLISSGFLDSLALFNLTEWIETKTGRAIDPTCVDIVTEWDSVSKVVRYITDTMAAPATPKTAVLRKAIKPSQQVGYEIVKYADRDKRAVAQFQTRLWSPDPELNVRYLEWKYERNPYAADIHIYLARHGGEIVGMRGFYASRWETGIPSQLFDVPVADDLLIREEHRNGLLLPYLMNEACQSLRSQADFVFNLSGGPLTVMGALATGWRGSGTLNPARRISSSAKRYRAFRDGLSNLPFLRRYAGSPKLHHITEVAPFVQLDRATTPVATPSSIFIDIDHNPRPAAMAALVQRIGHDGRLRHVRDNVYFDWRFQNPLHEYRFLFAGSDSLQGYLALKRSRNPNDSRVSVVDLETTDAGTQRALLQTAVEAGAFAELTIWTAHANAELHRQLNDLQFTAVESEQAGPRAPRILVRTLEDAGDDDWRLAETPLLDSKNWDMRMLYSMAG